MKVAVYNIWNGGEGRRGAIATVVRAANPDAIALLEAGDHATAMAFGNELGMNVTFGEANSEFPIAWLTRSPVRDAVNHQHPQLAKTLLEVELDQPDGPQKLFATHLTPGISAADCGARDREMDVILGILSRTAPRHLLVGDFNAVHPGDRMGAPPPDMKAATETPWAMLARPIQRMLEAGYLDAYRRAHPSARGFTWRTDHLWLRIDFAFVSCPASGGIVDCDVVSTAPARDASDHLPLVVTIA